VFRRGRHHPAGFSALARDASGGRNRRALADETRETVDVQIRIPNLAQSAEINHLESGGRRMMLTMSTDTD
jgi:hypothetical protein